MNRASAGFTLLEVMVALAIITIGLAAAIRAGSSQSMNAAHLKDKTLAYYVAANQAANLQLQLQSGWPAPGTQNGHEYMGFQEWHWQTLISETADKNLRRADIDVGLEKNSPLITLSVFLPQPAQSSP